MKPRRSGGAFWAFLAHYAVILAVIYTSAQATTLGDGPRQESITFVQPERQEVVEKEPPPPELIAAPPPMRSMQALTALIDIPNVLPAIDLGAPVTDPNEFIRKGRLRDVGPASEPDSATRVGNVYSEFEVEKPVMHAPNSAAPVYPVMLRQAGVEGEALVSFIVDSSGRVDLGSFKVIRATHDLFAAAVKSALPRMRFIPAEVGEKRVRQLVQQPFAFAIVK